MDYSFVGVFAAGLLTFFSPCVLPMAPIITAQFLVAEDGSRLSRLKSTLLFSFGFLLTFTLMGLSIPLISETLGAAKGILVILSALVIVIYGLKMSGAFQADVMPPRLANWFSRTFSLPDFSRKLPKALHGFLFGATFGLTWTPCVGPILGGVLVYVASQDRSLSQSALLMASFGLGIVVPFLGIALGGDLVAPRLKRIKTFLPKIEYFTGQALVVVGLYMITQASFPKIFSSETTADQTLVMIKGESPKPLSEIAAGKSKLLFFYTDHCPICHAMESFLPNLEKDCAHQNFALVRINVERSENNQIANLFQVRAVPTLSLLSPDGKEISRSVGYTSETKLRQAIQMLAPSMNCASTSKEKAHPPQIKDGDHCPGATTGNGLTC